MTRILYVQYTNPGAYPPLVRGATLLAAGGAEVRMLGTTVAGTEPLDASGVPGVEVALMPPANGGWRLKAHYARYATWVARTALAWRPDWIYASDLFAAPIALAVRPFVGRGVVYHEHDVPSTPHQSWIGARCLAARRQLVRDAAVVIAPNAERAARLRSLGRGRTVLTVWNCPLRPRALPVRARSRDALRVVFGGSINRERLPFSVIDALALAPGRATLAIAGYETAGSRGYVRAVLAHARQRGLGDRVEYLGPRSADSLAEVCRGADVGLALMPVESDDENMRHMAGASNKVFEYIAAGCVPLVTELPEWRATFVDPGYALACDPRDVRSIADALTWVHANGAAAEEIVRRGWQRLHEQWNYETQFAPVLGTLLDGADVRPRTAEAIACAS